MMMATRRWVRQPNRKQTKLNKGSFQCVLFCFVLILLRNVFAWEITSCEWCWLLACCAEIKMKYSNDRRIENMPERFHRCTLKLVCVCVLCDNGTKTQRVQKFSSSTHTRCRHIVVAHISHIHEESRVLWQESFCLRWSFNVFSFRIVNTLPVPAIRGHISR